MIAAPCSACLRMGRASDMQTGMVVLCTFCGHMMIFNGEFFRDLYPEELTLESNQTCIKVMRERQQALCLAKGWFG